MAICCNNIKDAFNLLLKFDKTFFEFISLSISSTNLWHEIVYQCLLGKIATRKCKVTLLFPEKRKHPYLNGERLKILAGKRAEVVVYAGHLHPHYLLCLPVTMNALLLSLDRPEETKAICGTKFRHTVDEFALNIRRDENPLSLHPLQIRTRNLSLVFDDVTDDSLENVMNCIKNLLEYRFSTEGKMMKLGTLSLSKCKLSHSGYMALSSFLLPSAHYYTPVQENYSPGPGIIMNSQSFLSVKTLSIVPGNGALDQFINKHFQSIGINLTIMTEKNAIFF